MKNENGGGESRLHPAVRNERKQSRLARAYANALASKVLTNETNNGLTEPLAERVDCRLMSTPADCSLVYSETRDETLTHSSRHRR